MATRASSAASLACRARSSQPLVATCGWRPPQRGDLLDAISIGTLLLLLVPPSFHPGNPLTALWALGSRLQFRFLELVPGVAGASCHGPGPDHARSAIDRSFAASPDTVVTSSTSSARAAIPHLRRSQLRFQNAARDAFKGAATLRRRVECLIESHRFGPSQSCVRAYLDVAGVRIGLDGRETMRLRRRWPLSFPPCTSFGTLSQRPRLMERTPGALERLRAAAAGHRRFEGFSSRS